MAATAALNKAYVSDEETVLACRTGAFSSSCRSLEETKTGVISPYIKEGPEETENYLTSKPEPMFS